MEQLYSDFWDILLQMISGCYFKDTFHLYCPGCGSTRAVIELFQLHMLKSLYYNPLPLYLLLNCIVMTATVTIERHGHRKKQYLKVRMVSNILCLLVLTVFFLIRNYLLVFRGIDMLGDIIG